MTRTFPHWLSALVYANTMAHFETVRYRVRSGSDGWVAEPAYIVKEKFYPSAEEWIEAYSQPLGGLSGGSCRD
jgi:hypothetical protein